MLGFEWSDEKAKANLGKHGVAFEDAIVVFKDTFAVEFYDDRYDYGEDRYVLIGLAGQRLITVVYAERGENRVRLISARPAAKMEPMPITGNADDDDDMPLTADDMARMKQSPRARVIRRALGLSQEEFASRYGIPLATMRDWERGRSQPDQTARAYLEVIAAEPDTTARAHARASMA